MSDFTLTHSFAADTATLRLTAGGRLTIENAALLQARLIEQTAAAQAIQLELSSIEQVDLAGLQVICSACRTNLDSGKRFNFAGALPVVITDFLAQLGLTRQTICKHNDQLPCIWCGGIN